MKENTLIVVVNEHKVTWEIEKSFIPKSGSIVTNLLELGYGEYNVIYSQV